jgi:purine nucleosidase
MLIDSDGGIDDAAAIWWAVTSPLVDVVGITTVHGNVETDVATANIHRVLEAAGRSDIPVAFGATQPIGPVPSLRRADFVHGTDGLGNTNRRAAASRTTASLEELWAIPVDALVTLGPLSTVALGIERLSAQSSCRLVVMGGAVAVPGNAMPMGEANIAHDPVAASVVLGSSWSAAPLLVGLDVTHRATFAAREVALIEERRNEAARWLADPLAFYRSGGSAFVPAGETPCHDLLAVMAAVIDDLVEGPVLPLAVQTEPGPSWGTTVADRRGLLRNLSDEELAVQPTPPGFVPVRVGLRVDVERYRNEVSRFFGSEN